MTMKTMILAFSFSALFVVQTAFAQSAETGGNIGRDGSAVIAPGQSDCDSCDVLNAVGNRKNAASFGSSHGAFTYNQSGSGKPLDKDGSNGVAD